MSRTPFAKAASLITMGAVVLNLSGVFATNPGRASAMPRFSGDDSTQSASVQQDSQRTSEASREGLRRLAELVKLAQDRGAVEVTPEAVVESAIKGMLRKLDPHTNFFPAAEWARLRAHQRANDYGIGVKLGMRDGAPVILSAVEGGPAARAGIRAGDLVVSINDEPTASLMLDEVTEKLKGPQGTQVRLIVKRRGLAAPLTATVTRDEVPRSTVLNCAMLTPETGYLALAEFTRSTGRDTADCVARLETQGMKQLLLDVRGNGGGLTDAAEAVASLFLPSGTVVAEARGRAQHATRILRANGSRAPLDLPVVALVDEGTASACEILVGALQDHDVALIAGRRTWGKGTMQATYNLPNGSGIALTTARSFTPSGRLLQRDYSSYFDYYAGPQANPAHGAVFHTDLGREVRGGGGITPDVVFALDPFVAYLVGRNAFAEFAVGYRRRHPKLAEDWKPSQGVLNEFRSWLVAAKLATMQEVNNGLASDAAHYDAMLHIHAEILGVAFGPEARSRVLNDSEVWAASDLFDHARDLLAQRRARPLRLVEGCDGCGTVKPSQSSSPPPSSSPVPNANDDPLRPSMSLFATVLSLVRQNYVDERDESVLLTAALAGATEALGPFAAFVPPGVAGDVRAIGRPQAGMVVAKGQAIAYVVAVEPGSPADAAGVTNGDIVSKIDGHPTYGMSVWDVEQRLAASSGKRVRLDLYHLGKPLTRSLTLALTTPAPPSLTQAGRATILRIPTFDAATAPAVARLLAGADAANAPGLIVDLRGVATGDPDAAYTTAALFARDNLGSLIRRSEQLRAFASERDPVWQGRLVVLVDRSTLGASEILATVLRQSADAEIVGELTFGHAGRRASAELASGGRLLFTDAFYTGPDRKPLNRGLDPDLKVDERSRGASELDMPLRDLILKRGVERLLSGEGRPRRGTD